MNDVINTSIIDREFFKKFKKAKCIELHDANLLLSTEKESCFNTSLIGRSEEISKPVAHINLGDIAMIAEMLSLSVKNNVTVSDSSRAYNDLNGMPEGASQNINDINLAIHKAQYSPADEDGSQKIIMLGCEIISEKLVNILIVSVCNGKDDEEVKRIETMSYSGNYTVWWELTDKEIAPTA